MFGIGEYLYQEKIFTFFTACSRGQKFYPMNLLSCVNDYIEPVATFTAWANIYSTKYFCNSKVAGMFVQQKILAVGY